MNEKRPEQQCRVVKHLLVFYCPLCLKEHAHGLASQKPGVRNKTHRVAHCTSKLGRKTYSETGYYIFYGNLPKSRARFK